MADAPTRQTSPAQLFRTGRQFTAELVAMAPRRVALAALLLLLVSFAEGAGLLLLMPLLVLVGAVPFSGQQASGWFDRAFAVAGLVPSLGSVLLLFVGVTAVRVLLQRWQIRLVTNVRETFISETRLRIYRAIAGSEWRFFVTRRPSDFAHVLTGEIGQLGGSAYLLMESAALAVTSAVYIILAFRVSPPMALVVLACAGVLAWGMRGSLKQGQARGARALAARGRLHAAIAEHMGSMKTAKSYGATGRHDAAFAELSNELQDTSLDLTAADADLQQRLELGSTLLLAAMVFAAHELLAVSAGQLLVLLLIFARLMPRLVSIYRQLQSLSNMLPVYDTVRTLERECLEAAERSAGLPQDVTLSRAVRFDRVTFAYTSRADRAAVRDVSVDIPAGLTTAIVGASGSGKTTLADLLLGLLPPTTGRILIDDRVLDAECRAAWLRQVSYVQQDTFLFHDTIRVNLTWARPQATDDEVWQALRLAAADTFVASLPQALDTVVGERGVLVSGGERQRLSLARAILRKPRMLVLDEATSSLDSENELRIQRAIENLHRQMTIVVITHRLSTIRQADLIHVMEQGAVIESGTWSELYGRPGSRFRALCVAQGIADRLAGEPDDAVAGRRLQA